MITLEQVRLLDRKVNQAVELIAKLRSENQMLNSKLESYQEKISELEVLLSGLKEDQSEVEHGFQKALETLSVLEESEESTASPAPAVSVSETEPVSEEVEVDTPDEETVPVEEDEEIATTGASDEEESEDAELDIF